MQPFASPGLPHTDFPLPSPTPLSAGPFSEKNLRNELFSSLLKVSPHLLTHQNFDCTHLGHSTLVPPKTGSQIMRYTPHAATAQIPWSIPPTLLVASW